MPTSSRCPVCRKPTVADYRPFCSRGCRDRDLVNWLDEGYRMPARPDEEEQDDTPARGEA